MKFWHRWRGFRQYSDSGLHTGNQARDTHGPRTQGILLVMPPLFRTTTCNFTNPAFFYGKFLNPLPFWENFENSTPSPLSLYKGGEGFKLCWMTVFAKEFVRNIATTSPKQMHFHLIYLFLLLVTPSEEGKQCLLAQMEICLHFAMEKSKTLNEHVLYFFNKTFQTEN